MSTAQELDRTQIALDFISAHVRTDVAITYRQIADHLTEVTGTKHTRNMVAGLLDRSVKRMGGKRKAA